MLNAAWKKIEANENAAVAFAIDAIPMNETYVWGFHKYGNFAAVRLALAKCDVVGSCRYSVLTVLCGVADAFSVDDDGAVASNLAYTMTMKVDFKHNCIYFS